MCVTLMLHNILLTNFLEAFEGTRKKKGEVKQHAKI